MKLTLLSPSHQIWVTPAAAWGNTYTHTQRAQPLHDLYLLTAPSCFNGRGQGSACIAETNPQTSTKLEAGGILRQVWQWRWWKRWRWFKKNCSTVNEVERQGWGGNCLICVLRKAAYGLALKSTHVRNTKAKYLIVHSDGVNVFVMSISNQINMNKNIRWIRN